MLWKRSLLSLLTVFGLLLSMFNPLMPAPPVVQAQSTGALDLGSGTAFVAFGDPAALDLAQFTIETWFKREGTGVTTSTGGGGVSDAIPLVTKGRGEAENSNLDTNWFLGIRASDSVLFADFEEGAGGASPGLNHPVIGTTSISLDTWYHAAATYDGNTWRLYLNGELETEVVVGQPPRSDSIQHAGLGSAMRSGGTSTAAGHFDGVLDEVRIWDHARTHLEIQTDVNSEITTAQTGLVARWGLDETSGTTVSGSAGTSVNGTIQPSGHSWVTPGAPLDIVIAAPSAPTGLAATARLSSRIDLAWTDNASNETSFEIERSTTGIGGTYSPLDTVAANVTAYSDLGLTSGQEYCYRVRATNAGGDSAFSDADCATTPAAASNALDFNGSTDYVTFGPDPALGLAQFTLETWFKREGNGQGASTGSGGIASAIPLVTKGRGEGDGSNVDMNYFFGIDASTGVLVADFEDMDSGGNHPVAGTTPIANDVWYHAAATYDGSDWVLYLNGVLDGTENEGATPRSDSIQHAGLATAMTSIGSRSGYFDGVLDEARIWNSARSEAEIRATINDELSSPQAGLVARWGLNEGSGTMAYNAAGSSADGTVGGAAWVTPGAPFNISFTVAPAAPTGLSATTASHAQIDLAWTDNADNETNFEVERSTTGSGGPFSPLITLPANAESHSDLGLTPGQEYCYQVRATNAAGESDYTSVQCDTTDVLANPALDFGGTDDYVTFGDPAALDLAQFTVETWFKREGAGETTTTGTGGVTNAIPLVTKGRGEAEGSNVDTNYFLGIRASDNVLFADFEEGATGSSPGQNHPVIGTTPINNDTWYHVAATYDGNKWQLFLNGNLEAELVVGQPPRSDSIQHAGLASAMTSAGTAAGYFDGVLDEVRIWDHARSQLEIQTDINSEITTPQAGLVACWGLNEGSGTAVNGSAGTTVNGTVMGTGYSWAPGAPFDIVISPPAAPTDLAATAVSAEQINLTWLDNADNEANFEIERSTDGIGGTYSPLDTVGANATDYSDLGLTAGQEYCYRVRATSAGGESDYSDPDCATTTALPNSALDFAGTDGYVTFGVAPGLGLAQFTVETWFKREGTGQTTTTGTGGVTNAIPLVTKGRGEAEGSNVDTNYFLGIRASDNVLFADFEEGASAASPGLNHPVIGTTPISNDSWYHVAATYDGNKWQLFLNGNLEAELVVGEPVRSDSIQHAGLATAMRSSGAPEGYFDGVLDEVRIWDHARTQLEIQTDINAEIETPQAGLVGRWSLDEGTGTAVNASAGTSVNGTVMGTGYAWVTPGAPFDIVIPAPAAPTALAATERSAYQIDLAWTDNAGNETGFEIERSTTGIGGAYTPLDTAEANVTAYSDLGLTPEQEYCYRVRATNATGPSTYADPDCATTPAEASNALDFNGSSDYVTFGQAPALGLAQFTIETWFKREGPGQSASTGTGGIDAAIPLVTKGRGEADGNNRDMNYFLGIDASAGVLVADFEDMDSGGNHPVVGTTAIANDVWYHAAVTYDGANWKLYLNGVLDQTLAETATPRSDSIQHAGLATAITSIGTRQGYFDGVLDEARIWNSARSEAEIRATINDELSSPQAGLVARWGLNEGSGTMAFDSAGSAVHGTVSGAAWVTPGAPFNISFTVAPAAPTGLSATTASHAQIDLTWTDNADNETNFEVERSTTGSGGPFSPLITLPANAESHSDLGLTPGQEYCYQVRATNAAGESDYTSVQCDTTDVLANPALDFGGTDDYVTFGDPAALDLAQFTVETWFKREGAGETTTTGTGGVTNAIPLVTKGRGEAEGSNVDTNYFLGIRASDNVLFADFEEGATGSSPGQNHPVIGTTPINNDTWYHVAATYDGNKWQLFLNGNLEAELVVGQPPRSDSIQHAGLASAMTSAGTAAGYFDGVLDEVRIWDHARSQLEIQTDINSEITTPQAGLVACWGLNEGSGTAVNGSAGTTVNGTVMGTGYSWAPGAPFDIVISPPAAPTDLAATAVSAEQINLAWTDNADNETSFEIQRSTTGIAGTYSPLDTVAANIISFSDLGLTAEEEYCYRVRATNVGGESAFSDPDCATTTALPNSALDFVGTDAYVTFGPAPSLGLAQFTVETWFKREGPGVTTTTGTGGVDDAIPLVTKGTSEADDADNKDMNYFLGIRASDSVLMADFEEGAGGSSPSLNHPIIGTTTLSNDTWYHAAATYDGNKWQLFLNGNLEAELVVGEPVRSDSIQHAGLGSAMISDGTPEGFFDGVIDEVRIWDHARTHLEIQGDVNSEITTPQAGLVGRWSLDEATGTAVNGSAGTTVNGTVMGTGYTWVTPGAPFNIAVSPPAAPTALAATAASAIQIDLAWTDNSDNETGFEIERSTTGIGGTYGPLHTTSANATAYSDSGLDPETEYCYRARATNAAGESAYAGPDCATTPAEVHNALDFGTNNAYVTFGPTSTLGLAQFTLETWFKREGAGVTTNTGSGGVGDAIPLVTKGTGEVDDADNKDMNYFLGIRASDSVLIADFEEGGGGSSPSQNHPIIGTTAISNDTWYHAAATYDGNKWQLFLNGNLEAELVVGQPVRSDSIQHAGLGTAMLSDGTPAGFFDGVLDEARIWDHARTHAQIQGDVNSEIKIPQAGLVARWGLDEGSGTDVHDSTGSAVNGTILGTGYSWVTPGAPFDIAFSVPAAPTGLAASASSANSIGLSWTDNASDETNFEIERSTTGIGGTYSPLDTIGANTTAYSDSGLAPETEYCYRVRATNASGPSAYSNADCATTTTEVHTALDFGTNNAYVTFGPTLSLGLPEFTVETWFKREGTGVTTSTGSGGVTDAIPLVTKGVGEVDVPDNRDMNYFLGIRASDGVLIADFEEGAAGSSPSQNHPVIGTTSISNNTWYHAAVTYDGNKWQLFLNGNLEAELVVGEPVRSDSIQHAGLATAMTSTGAPEGYFDGVLDEVRIWDHARSVLEIQLDANSEITTPRAGLVARWGLDEGSGTAVNGSAGTTVNGTVMGSGYSWVGGAPFNLNFNDPPDAPTALTATAYSHAEVHLAWTDNADNEAIFDVERSTTGIGGTYSPLGTGPANVTTYSDLSVVPEQEYCYRVRARNAAGPSAYTNMDCATTPVATNHALDFGSSNAYVTFGPAPTLGLPEFTIETWFKRQGAGQTTTTGTGGVDDAIPLLTNGTSEVDDADNKDMNYFLGIRASDSVLMADFEEGAGGSSPSLNHPIIGTTTISNDIWYHAAATYDGNKWQLFLNGRLEAELVVGEPPRSDSIQHAGLATAMESDGTPEGRFDGVIDEARVWDSARTQTEIRATINDELAGPQAGLVARWGLDEGTGTTVGDTAGSSVTGTVMGSGYSWVGGAPFNLIFNDPPYEPTLVQPANGAVGVVTPPTLEVTVSDPELETMDVNFYGREAGAGTGEAFSIIVLPDTQYYSESYPQTFSAQTQWIVQNKDTMNIAFVTHEGDIVEVATETYQWDNADAAMSLLEDPATTGLPDGIPYGLVYGNHDMPTDNYNTYFPVSRFAGRGYYGGSYDGDNEDSYQLFDGGGMGFIAIHFGYYDSPPQSLLDWADGLLKTHSDRRAIVVAHRLIGSSGAWSSQGQATYDALKDNPNLFLMLCGHVTTEARRTDVYNGNTVYTLLADYQSRSNGGNGWLRILELSPTDDVIHVKTYSPTLNQFETDANSQFDLSYDMDGAGPFSNLGTVSGVASGGNASIAWPGLFAGTPYEWYVEVSDGSSTTEGPIWNFTTFGTPPPCYTLTTSVDPASGGTVVANPAPNCQGTKYHEGTVVELTANANSGYIFANWSGALTGSTNPDSVTMNGNRDVTAHFDGPPCYSLTTAVFPVGAGTIDVAPPPDCAGGTYSEGTVVQLTANANTGYTFVNWTGHLSSSTNPDSLTMNANKSVTALFGEFTGATLDLQVSQDSDDAEERLSSGAVNLGSWDLDLTDDNGNVQTVGIRFQNVTIPQGANIQEAHVTFYAAGVQTGDTDLLFQGHDTDDAPTFSEASGDISGRTITSASIPWDNVPPWTTLGDPYDSPNLAPIIQEIVDRGGWTSGNGLALLISGTGKRDAESFDGDPGMAPELHITYGEHSVPSSHDLTGDWTLIAPTVQTDPPTDAEAARTEILNQGGNALQLCAWLSDVDDWQCYDGGPPGNNFTLQLGQGYFVQVDQASTWQRTGEAPASPVPVQLNPTWTLIGLPKLPAPMTAETLLDEASAQGGDCTELYQWQDGRWEGHVRDLPFNNFNLGNDVGYFVKCANATTYTPGGVTGLLTHDPELASDENNTFGRSASVTGLPNHEPARAASLHLSKATTLDSAPAQLLASYAATIPTVSDILVSNHRDVTFSVSWRTDSPSSGWLEYGETEQLGTLAQQDAAASMVHHVTLTQLKPNTTYFFRVHAGKIVDDMGSALYSVTTKTSQIPALPFVAYGQVQTTSGQPAVGALVRLWLASTDGSLSEPLSATVDDLGYWSTNLPLADCSDLQLKLEVIGPAGGQVELSMPACEVRPAQTVKLP